MTLLDVTLFIIIDNFDGQTWTCMSLPCLPRFGKYNINHKSIFTESTGRNDSVLASPYAEDPCMIIITFSTVGL